MKLRSSAPCFSLRVLNGVILIAVVLASCAPYIPAQPVALPVQIVAPESPHSAVPPLPIVARAPTSDAAASAEPALANIPAAVASPSNSLDSAFVRDVDLGNGQHQAVVSQYPLNYQAADGTWQPIEPRFEAVPQGFVNRRNSFEIAASDQRAALRLRSGNNLIGWEAQAVALITSSGAETLLATPLRAEEAVTGTLADDGRTIRYANNWTLPDLVEELTAGPGQVEQSLIFGSRPAGLVDQSGADRFFTLRATLHLLPGQQLFAKDHTQTAAFDTEGAIEIRDAQGTSILALAPARAFEQQNPVQAVAAHYRLTPQDDDTWEVAVDTPAAWWADPARVYPVVFDPTMGVLRPFTVTNYTNNGVCVLPVEAGDSWSAGAAIGAWYGCPAIYRSFIRFDLPTLPPGAQLTKAELLAAPTRGAYVDLPGGIRKASANVELRRVTSSWVNWYTQTDPTPIDGIEQLTVYDSETRNNHTFNIHPYQFASWTLPNSMVNEWLTYPITRNFGLRLRLRSEDELSCIGNPGTCDMYVEVPSTNTWTQHDKDAARLGDLPLIGSEQGGFMLLLTYTPPTLQNGVTRTIDVFPTMGGDDYYRTYHTYMTPDTHAGPGAWMIAGVKGFDNITPTGRIAVGSTAANMVPGEEGQTNYILYPASYAQEFQVYAPQGEPITAYRLEARGSTQLPGNPTIQTFQVHTHTFTMSSTQLFRVFDLNLVAGTKVKVAVSADGLRLTDLRARLFRPGAGTTYRDSGESQETVAFTVPTGQSGVWALVIEFLGPSASRTGIFAFDATITVQACPPTYDFAPIPCNCSLNAQPDASTPNKPVGDFIVYAPNGFTDDGANWTTVMPAASCKTPTIGWKTGGKQSLVAVSGAPLTYVANEGRLYGDEESLVSLIKFPLSNGQPQTYLWKGFFLGHATSGADRGYLVWDPAQGTSALVILEQPDEQTVNSRVSVQSQRVEATATLTRQIAPASSFVFGLDYMVYAGGVDDPTFVYTPTFVSGPTQVNVANLSLRPGNDWTIDFDTVDYAPGRFTSLRSQSIIVQPATLGGAALDIQAVLLSLADSTQLKEDGTLDCTADYCLDPRSPDDAFGHLVREWAMPDVTINNYAQTVMYQSAGQSGRHEHRSSRRG